MFELIICLVYCYGLDILLSHTFRLKLNNNFFGLLLSMRRGKKIIYESHYVIQINHLKKTSLNIFHESQDCGTWWESTRRPSSSVFSSPSFSHTLEWLSGRQCRHENILNRRLFHNLFLEFFILFNYSIKFLGSAELRVA